MQISPETMELLMRLAAPDEQKLALFKALERDWLAYSQPATAVGETEETERLRNASTYAERKRAKDRARRATEREEYRRLKAERVESSATTPETPPGGDDEATATEGDQPATTPHVGARKSSLTSSLRSEAYPPENTTCSTPKGSEKRGARLPEDWRPDPEDWAYASDNLGGEVASQAQLDRFRDYWRGVPGAKGRKLDWPGTWRNWVRRALENSPRNAHDRPHHDTKLAAKQANYARAWEGSERAAGRDGEP